RHFATEKTNMKLTWLGETALRIHIGGQVVVVDADTAPAGVDRTELLSGADLILALERPQQAVDGASWRPRPAQRLLDAGDTVRPADVWSVGERALLMDPDEDRPLLILGGGVPELGRWVERAVILVAGPNLAERSSQLVRQGGAHLIALAGSEEAIEATIGALRHRLDGIGLVALEPGLAVEI